MDITNYIPYGKTNAIQRSTLASVMGVSDRKLRKQIELARNEGSLIINDQDGEGYYLSDDLDEIERHYRSERKRALMILKRLKKSRRLLREAGRI